MKHAPEELGAQRIAREAAQARTKLKRDAQRAKIGAAYREASAERAKQDPRNCPICGLPKIVVEGNIAGNAVRFWVCPTHNGATEN